MNFRHDNHRPLPGIERPPRAVHTHDELRVEPPVPRSGELRISAMARGQVLALQRSVGNRAVAAMAAAGLSVQRIGLADLNKEQSSDYQKWVTWAKDKALNVPQLLLHAPNYAEFQGFMTYVYKNVDQPPLGFDATKFYKEALNKYWKRFPQPVQKAGWGGVANNVLPPPVVVTTPPVQVQKPSPAHATAPFLVMASGQKHFKHVPKNSDLPRDVSALADYVQKNAAHFVEAGDHWTLQLGEYSTHQGFAQYEVKPWSILIRPGQEPGRWEVFHYGPTGMEKD